MSDDVIAARPAAERSASQSAEHSAAVHASLANGVAVATGAFSVDRDKARDKLRHFQLADPCGWLIEAVRAAVVVGASAIHVETDSDDVHVRFDGTAFDDDDIQELYAALLAKKSPPARQHLAVALNGAMALGPRFVRLTTDGGLELEMRPDVPDRIGRIKRAEPAKVAGQATHIWVREPFRAGRFVSFFRSLAGTKREILALERACRFLTIPVHVNGNLVSRKPPAHDARADVDTRECVGTVFLSHDVERAAGGGRVVLLHRGVVLEVLEHEMMPSNVVGIVEAKGIDRDASLGAFHRSPAFWTVIDKVLRTSLALVEAPGPDDGKSAERMRAAVRAFGKAIIDGELRRHDAEMAGLHSVATALLARDRPLRNAPVFRDVRGEPVSLNALCAEIELRGKVLVSTVPARAAVTLERVVVHTGKPEDRELLAHVLGDLVAGGHELVAAAEERARTRARFLSRRGPTTLPPSSWLARRKESANEVTFEIGLRENAPRGLAATFFVDGCLACTKLLPWPLTGLALAIEGPFKLNDACNDVVIDAAFVRALRAAWCAVPALYEEAIAAALAGKRTDDRPVLFDGAMWLLAWAMDADALWQSFIASVPGVQQVSEGLAPLPPVALTGPRAHALVRLPILRRVDGALVAIADVPRPIPVVPWEVERCSKPDAIRASPTLRALLESFAPLELHDELALREQRRFTILEGPVARDPGWSRTKPFGTAPLHGVLAAGTIAGLTLYVRTQGRPVTAIIMADAPVGPLSAIVDDANLLPLADGGVAEDDQHRHALLALSALPALLADIRGDAAGRSIALSVVRSLFPTSALRRAADILDAAAWIDLLAHVLADLDDKNATLDLVLEAGERPTVAALETFAAAAGGASPPHDAAKRARTTRQFTAEALAAQLQLRLAPFGGREAFLLAAREASSTSSPIIAAVIARVPAVGRLGFRTLDDRVVDVTAMASMDEVRYVPKEMARVGTETDGVLLLTDEVRPALVSLLGAKRFVDVSEHLRKLSALREFEAREVESPRLDIAGHTIVVDIDEAATKGRPRIRGQVGLLPLRSGAATFATVRVMRGGRTVMRHDLSAGAPCSFAAIIDNPELPMLADFSAPSSPGHLAKLFGLCVAAAESAIDTCVERYEENGDEDCRRLILERLARSTVVGIKQKRLRGLQAVKIFDTVERFEGDGGRASVADAIAAAVDGGVRFVSSLPTLRRRNWVNAKRRTDELVLVFMAGGVEQPLAELAIGVQLVDAGPAFEREERVRKQRDALAPLPPTPKDALVTVESVAGRSSIRAWIPRKVPRGSRRVVHGGAEGKHVRDADFDTPLHAFEAVLEGADLVNDDWSNVAIESATVELDDAALALGDGLLDVSDAADASDDVVDAVRLLAISLALRRHRVTPKWRPLLERAMELRLFAVGDGARISLTQALADRPPSLEKMLRAVGLVSELDAPASPSLASASHVAKLEAPPPPPPELVLAQRIAETLSLVKLEHDAETELARWPVSCERRGGKRAVTIGKNTTVVDLDHPLAKAALVDDGDPAAFFMLCAVVYAAVNAHLRAVTDDHERAFLTRLIDHARSART